MSRWNDPAIRARAYQLGGRVAAAVQEAKRAEAQARAARTEHGRTRAHRLGQCSCWLPERALPRLRRRKPRVCPWPGKVAYTTPQQAAWALGKHHKRRRWHQGLNVYPCPAGGHWHAGRLFHRISAWARAA